VAQGLAYPCGEAGDVLQNHMLPVGYSKVTPDAVTKNRYRAVELDYPEDERIGRHWGRTWVAKFFGASATYPLARILNPTMIWMTKTQKTHTNTGNQVFHHRYDPRLTGLVHLLGLQLNHLRTCKKTQRQRKNF
jgi:hypothetical protein